MTILIIVLAEVGFYGLYVGNYALLTLLHAALDTGLEVGVVRVDADNLLDVGTEAVGYLFGHGFGIACQ